MKRNPTTREHLRILAQLVKADGCSSAPDFWFTECCNEHDVYYRTGRDADGFRITRLDADKQLFRCMKKTAHTFVGRWFLSPLYWCAVRLFGRRAWKGA